MNDQSISQHLTYLKRRNARQSTVIHRHGQLLRLSLHLDKPLLEATETDLDAWQASLQVCASSIQTYSSHVRSFYDWAHETGLISANPAKRLVMPKIQRRLPRPIPEKDLETALQTSGHDDQLFAWFLLAGYCGLRACEVARVARPDFRDDPKGGAFLTVHGKGGADRVVRVPPDVFAELEIFMHRPGVIFRRVSGKPFTPNDVTRLASKHLKDIGLPYTLHTLRHRFATRLCDLGADPRDVQAAMGHTDLATTSLYLAMNVRRGSKKVDQLGAGLRAMSNRAPKRATTPRRSRT